MRSIFLIACMCCSLITLAQSNFKVSGIVIGVDKEPIIGATIQDKSNQTGVITDVMLLRATPCYASAISE